MTIDTELLKIITSQFRPRLNSIHGISHWRRVKTIGDRLSIYTKADITVIALFAFLHDSRRFSEGEDIGHGERASLYCSELYMQGKLNISEKQLSQLYNACKFHSDRHAKTDDVTIATCWDADRLDLVRLGITPDPMFLYTDAGKNYLATL